MKVFRLNAASGVPIYRQIVDQVRYGVASGRLRPGQQLPTVRALAVDLCVNPNTVIKAYGELEHEGLVTTEQGTGTFVAPATPKPPSSADRQAKLRGLCLEFLGHAGQYGFNLSEIAHMLESLKSSKG